MQIDMVDTNQFYNKLSELCIQKGLLTQEQSDTICRKGHRKGWAMKRHILDLVHFVMWKMDDGDIQDVALKELLEKVVLWCKK